MEKTFSGFRFSFKFSKCSGVFQPIKSDVARKKLRGNFGIFWKETYVGNIINDSISLNKFFSGERVMGITKNKGITNVVEADSDSTWTIPDNWSYEEAATVPIVYATVMYSLFMVNKLIFYKNYKQT